MGGGGVGGIRGCGVFRFMGVEAEELMSQLMSIVMWVVSPSACYTALALGYAVRSAVSCTHHVQGRNGIVLNSLLRVQTVKPDSYLLVAS